MAGYTENCVTGGDYVFHIDTPDVAGCIRRANNMKRVISLQLDGDELDAALWGLANYQKGAKVTIQHDRDCPCPREDCYAAPSLTKHGV